MSPDLGPHRQEAPISSGVGRLSCGPCADARTFSAAFGFLLVGHSACRSVEPLPPLCVARFSKEETAQYLEVST